MFEIQEIPYGNLDPRKWKIRSQRAAVPARLMAVPALCDTYFTSSCPADLPHQTSCLALLDTWVWGREFGIGSVTARQPGSKSQLVPKIFHLFLSSFSLGLSFLSRLNIPGPHAKQSKFLRQNSKQLSNLHEVCMVLITVYGESFWGLGLGKSLLNRHENEYVHARVIV